MIYKLFSTGFMFFFCLTIWSQGEHLPNDCWLYSLGFQVYQAKDDTNYGRVFSALQFNGSITYKRTYKKTMFEASSSLAIGGGNGIEFRSKPLELSFLSTHKSSKNTVSNYIGPYTSAHLHWQIYIPYQSVEMGWLTMYELGLRIKREMYIGRKWFSIDFSNSIFGCAGRPMKARETHFYSLSVSDFVRSSHSDLYVGSYNLFNHTRLSITLLSKNSKWNIGYQFELFRYKKDAKFLNIGHQLTFIKKIGKSLE